MTDTKPCSPAVRAGRLAKAQQFLLAAETIATVIEDEEVADSYVTLCVHAGIAASDVIYCANWPGTTMARATTRRPNCSRPSTSRTRST